VATRRRVAQRVGRSSVSATFTGDMAAALRTFAAEKVAQIARPAARAGALVFYGEMRMKVPVDEGTLYGSIYHYYDKQKSTGNMHVYAIGPNKRVAPHWAWIEYGHWLYNRQAEGRWLESKSNKNARGPSAHDLPGRLDTPRWVPADPYIRPAFGQVQRAIDAALTRAKEKFAEVAGGADE
jgi:hypothetical protein